MIPIQNKQEKKQVVTTWDLCVNCFKMEEGENRNTAKTAKWRFLPASITVDEEIRRLQMMCNKWIK